MTDTIPLQMESHRGGKEEHGQIILRQSHTPRDLAESISNSILNRNSKVQYKDISILVRAGSQVRDIETELVKNRVPYIVRGAMGLLQAEEVKDILSYLKIASNSRDFSALRRSSGVPKRGVGDAALERVMLNANERHNGDLMASLKAASPQKLQGYVMIIDELEKRSHNPSDAIDYLVKAIHYEDYLKKKYTKHRDKLEQKLVNIERLKEMINALIAEREMTIDDVVFQLTMQDQKDIGGDGKVIISTIHAAKGLEWKTVYVVGLYDGSIPHKFCVSDEEICEERRLFYVACTRAKDTLVLGVPAAIEFAYKEPQWVAPSRFLTELGVCK
jgi:ATP-dependent DNA helicase Rep